MNTKKNRWARIIVLMMAIFMCFAMTTVSALGYSYTTDGFDVDIVVGEDNTYEVHEKISVDFAVDKHGIYRYIPVGYSRELGRMSLYNIYVEDYNYTNYVENNDMVIQIGDEDVYVRGPQEYNLFYDIDIYEDRDETRDFFYLDVIPTGWETPIESSSVSIEFPKKIDPKDIEFYIGRYGSVESVEETWDYDEATNKLTIETGRLGQGVGVTVFCELPEGYWVGEAGYGWAKVTTMALGVILPIVVILLWFLFGRDKQIIPTVEFYPPEGMTPAEVGYVMDGQADKKDLLSLIIYFADKGYISIEEVTKDGLFDKKDFIITKLREIDGNEKNFCHSLFLGLFRKGDSVRVSELDEDFGDNYLTAHEQLYGHYFKKKNRQVSLLSGVLQMICLVLLAACEGIILALAQWYSGEFITTFIAGAAIILSAIFLVLAINRTNKIHTMSKRKKFTSGLLIWVVLAAATAVYGYIVATMIELVWFTAVLFILFMGACIAVTQMQQRTKKSIELMGKLLGLKNFIETAELDRINMLVDENPNYFYNVLPYAYVMGLTDKWAKNFENINIARPTWYVGTNNTDMFDVWMMSRMLNNCNRNISNNIKYTVHEDSGGGGGFSSGGGGFSGGGFGGGGGGSW